MKVIERLIKTEERMDQARNEGNKAIAKKLESVFATCLKNIQKSKKASAVYEEMFGISIDEEIENWI